MAKILVVDDSPMIREPIAGALGGAGHTVLCATGGAEALAMALAERPDLMLLDVNMPGVDGLTCLAILRRHLTPAQLPVILLTADEDKSHVLQAAKLGVQGYLLKSTFTLSSLFERIAKHVAGGSGGSSSSSRSGQSASSRA